MNRSTFVLSLLWFILAIMIIQLGSEFRCESERVWMKMRQIENRMEFYRAQ